MRTRRPAPNTMPNGTVRNLVCRAIMTLMEGAYGNREGHRGSASGRSRSEGSIQQGRVIRRAEEGAGRTHFERRARRSSWGRAGGWQAQPPQWLFEEERSDGEFEARHKGAARPRGDIRSQADRPLSAPVPWLRREDRIDVCARHDGARDSGPLA